MTQCKINYVQLCHYSQILPRSYIMLNMRRQIKGLYEARWSQGRAGCECVHKEDKDTVGF